MNDEQTIVEAHMHLVRVALDRFGAELPKGINMDEVHSCCVSALRGAAKKHDSNSGVSFEQYASDRIRGAMFDSALRYVHTQPGTKKQPEEVSHQDNEKLPLSWFTPNTQIYERMLASPKWPQLLSDELAQLPEATREIILLHYIENKAFAEIATHFGLSEAHISSIHDRVLMKIFARYQDTPMTDPDSLKQNP